MARGVAGPSLASLTLRGSLRGSEATCRPAQHSTYPSLLKVRNEDQRNHFSRQTSNFPGSRHLEPTQTRGSSVCSMKDRRQHSLDSALQWFLTSIFNPK